MADVDTTTDSTEESTTTDTTDDKPLAAEGEKALAAWKERAKKAEAEAKRTPALEAELAALREAQMSEQEKAIDAARKEAADAARAEVLGEATERLFRSELRAATAGKLSDPDLLSDPMVAQRLLGLDEVPVTVTGDIDSEAISTAVAAFLEAKPHLQAGATRPPDLDQGARKRTDRVDPATITDPAEVRKWAAGNRK